MLGFTERKNVCARSVDFVMQGLVDLILLSCNLYEHRMGEATYGTVQQRDHKSTMVSHY